MQSADIVSGSFQGHFIFGITPPDPQSHVPLPQCVVSCFKIAVGQADSTEMLMREGGQRSDHRRDGFRFYRKFQFCFVIAHRHSRNLIPLFIVSLTLHS